MPANRETIMFVEIIPVDKQNETTLMKATQDLHGELGGELGLVVEFTPGKGVSLYFDDTDRALRTASVDELRRLLVHCGVRILKTADIQGVASVKEKKVSRRRQ